MDDNSISIKLQELFNLLKSGALSQNEYDLLKSELLNITKKTIVKDKKSIISEGIEKAICGDYQEAYNVLSPVLSFKKTNDLNNNRGILYLTYCLCKSSSELAEVSKSYADIDFEILRQTYNQVDEEKAIAIAEYIVKKSLNEIELNDSTEFKLKQITDSYLNNSLFTKTNNHKIALLWHIIGIKQSELSKFANALTSFDKAKNLMPDEPEYKNKYSEIQNIIQAKKQKRNKTIKLFSTSVFTLVIIITSWMYGHKYIDEKKAFEFAKKDKTTSSFDSYIVKYPKGKYSSEVKELKEELVWLAAKDDGTKERYEFYINSYPKGKYVSEAKELLDGLAWEEVKKDSTEESCNRYLSQFPNGKYVEKANNFLLELENKQSIEGKYSYTYNISLADGSSKIVEQYFNFFDNGKCKCLVNICSGFEEVEYEFVKVGKHIKVGIYGLTLISNNKLRIDDNIDAFTCGNWKNGSSLTLMKVDNEVGEVKETGQEESADETPFTVADEMPSFMGGDAELQKYIAANINYPKAARENRIQGKVIVRFCVTSTGSVNQVIVLKGVDPELDNEAIRIIKTLPSFKVGRIRGNPVPVWNMVAVIFKLE